MKEIIPPVEKYLLEKELTPEKFLRKTNYGNNDIFIFTYKDSPNLMREIGRLREISFRVAGGGTGKDSDLDEFDISENPYTQLIVWNSNTKEILGGYRYLNCRDLCKSKKINIEELATSEIFKFSQKFIDNYLPYTIELGRSFVQPEFQAGKSGRKTLFALDNLWDGLGALIVNNPEVRYFFGKVTMYTHYDILARDLILYFMNKNFPDKDKLVEPIKNIILSTDEIILKNIFTGSNYTENYKILSKQVRERKMIFPPLINSYMNLSPTMRSFGTSINPHFGGVEETGIMINIPDIYESKKKRHLSF